ncbi:MAG: transposase, partial [Candidatus Gastranaerophilales bacterium]|nr:transposase [Candidatus Gastranaerophilales bacterium]
MPNYKRVFADNHYIFITAVTFKRNPILIENIKLLRESFKKTQGKYNYEIFGIVVLPDHFHMILKPDNINEYPKIISLIKWHFAWNIDEKYIMKNQLSKSNIKRKEKGIWQRRYY